MKTLLLVIAALCIAIGVQAQALNTSVVGNSTLTNMLVVSGKACKLYAVTGQNLSGSTAYVQVFQTITNPIAGQTPTFSIPVPASPQFFSVDFSYYGADLYPGCMVYMSTSSTNLAIAAGSGSTIQAIIRSN